MRSNASESQFEDNLRSQGESHSAERRNLDRREQPDRREIERFGFEIISRRSGSDRRKT